VPVRHASIEAFAPEAAPISLKQAVASITALHASESTSQTVGGLAIAAVNAPDTNTTMRPSENRILKKDSDSLFKNKSRFEICETVDDYKAASPTEEELVIASISFGGIASISDIYHSN
jgi:hypothetical protein